MKRYIMLIVALILSSCLLLSSSFSVSADTLIDYGCDGEVDITLSRDEFYNAINFCFDSVTAWHTDQSSLVSISKEAGVLMSTGASYPYFCQAGLYTYQKNSSLVTFNLLFSDSEDLSLYRNGSTYNFYLYGNSCNFCLVNLQYNVLNNTFSYVSFSTAKSAPAQIYCCNKYSDALDLTTYYAYSNGNYESTSDVMWAIIPDFTSFVGLGVSSESFGIPFPDYVPASSSDDSTDSTGKEQLEVSNSILDNIKNMFSKIGELVDLVFNLPEEIKQLLIYLFVPPEDFMIDIFFGYLEEKFPIVLQIGQIVLCLFDFTPYSDAPVFTFVWHRTEVPIVDFAPFSGVISIFWPIILAFSWGKFILWLLDYIPGLLGGVKY